MSDRYIRRFALPERLYTASAPVVLAAGVLLEDRCCLWVPRDSF